MWLFFLFVRISALWNKKTRRLVAGQKSSIARLSEVRHDADRWLWFHAASTGEAEQVMPVIKRLRESAKFGHAKILLTFFSPSGYEHFKDSTDVNQVLYLPFATRRRARRFLDVLRPEMAVFVKYEFWPAYLRQLKKLGVPTYSVASIFRRSQAFFRPITGLWYRRLLRCFTRLLVQDEQSRCLLFDYGIENTAVVGDPRFNRVLQIAGEPSSNDKFAMFSPFRRQNTIVAGSTWQPDEQLLARYVKEREDVRLILVPHEVTQEHLNYIFNLFEGRYVLYSELNEKNKDSARVIVVDQMGLLSRLYRYGSVAYVGGGFGVGIHNTLEAAAYGVPVLFGPNHKRFREACDLIDRGAGFCVRNYKSFSEVMSEQLSSPAVAGDNARQYVLSEQNATELIVKELHI